MSNTNTKAPTSLHDKKQIARHCNVSERCIDNWLRDRLIPYRKIGKLVRFDIDEVNDALRRFTVPAKTEKS